MDMTVAPAEREGGSVDEPWELPKGWCWAPISSCVADIARADPAKIFGEQEFHYVDLSAIHDGAIQSPQLISGIAAPSRARQILQPGDTLFSCVRVYLRNNALVEDGMQLPVGSTAFCVLRPRDALLPRYLNYFVGAQSFTHRMVPLQRGNSPPSVVDADVKSQLIALAPPAEQRRIVERIDALFSEIAEGEAALEDARHGLGTFHRSLLKAAVTGELTRDWRETNKPTETGHDLLVRIAAERRANVSKGRGKRAHTSEPLDTSDFPDLPLGWAWARVAEVGSVQLGRQRAPQHHRGENMHRYLRVANVFEDRIDLTDVKEMNFTPAELETFELSRHDILLNEGQTPDLLGRPAMWRSDERGICFQNTLLRFRVFEPMDPEFCLLVFRHYLHAKRFKRESQITTNIAHLSSGRFSVIEFPVPPIDEQREIVRLTLEALESAANIRIIFDKQASDSTRLRQTLLKSAFEGKLVPQDPNDEPANTALARLNVNKAPSRPAPRGRRKRDS